MRRTLLALLFLLATAAVGLPSVPRLRPPTVDIEPDPRQSRPLPGWPTDEDLARLAAAKGLSRGNVLRLLGHPCAVEHRANGVEVWSYPWAAACTVTFEGLVCTDTFYTGGY
jgi:hypothetical protein